MHVLYHRKDSHLYPQSRGVGLLDLCVCFYPTVSRNRCLLGPADDTFGPGRESPVPGRTRLGETRRQESTNPYRCAQHRLKLSRVLCLVLDSHLFMHLRKPAWDLLDCLLSYTTQDGGRIRAPETFGSSTSFRSRRYCGGPSPSGSRVERT